MSALVGSTATPLESVTGLGEGLIEKLIAAGVTTVEALADMTPEQLEAIEGIGPKTVEKISLAVNNYFSALEGGEAAAAAEEPPAESTPEGGISAEPEANVAAGQGEGEVLTVEAEPAAQESAEAVTSEAETIAEDESPSEADTEKTGSEQSE
jgi:transcription termination/antitermination protein NusA